MWHTGLQYIPHHTGIRCQRRESPSPSVPHRAGSVIAGDKAITERDARVWRQRGMVEAWGQVAVVVLVLVVVLVVLVLV